MKHKFSKTLTLSLVFVLIAFSLVLVSGCEANAAKSGAITQTSGAKAEIEAISDYSVPLAAPVADASTAFDSTPVRGAAPIQQPPVSREHASEESNP